MDLHSYLGEIETVLYSDNTPIIISAQNKFDWVMNKSDFDLCVNLDSRVGHSRLSQTLFQIRICFLGENGASSFYIVRCYSEDPAAQTGKRGEHNLIDENLGVIPSTIISIYYCYRGDLQCWIFWLPYGIHQL